MKSTLAFLCFLLITTTAFAQDNKMSIGAFGSIDQYDFDFKPVLFSDEGYTTHAAYSVGVNFRYKFTDRLFAQGGVQYAERGYTFDGWIPAGVGSGASDISIGRGLNTELGYLGVPLFVGYYVLNRERVKIAPALGLVSEFMLNDNFDSEPNSLNTTFFSPQLNLGFEYHFGAHWFASVEPYVRMNTAAIDPEIMEASSISYGGIMSVNYKF